MDEGRGQLIQPQFVEGCLNAGPRAGIGDQMVARAGHVTACMCTAVLAQRRRFVNATRRRHVYPVHCQHIVVYE